MPLTKSELSTHTVTRACFAAPIPEFDKVATLLDEAVDALQAGERERARTLIISADSETLYEFCKPIIGKTDPKIHWQTKLPKQSEKVDPRDKVKMPPISLQRRIFVRDGWHCRYCGIRVLSKDAIEVLKKEFPEEVRWGGKVVEKHFGLYALCVSIDHIKPRSRGGDNDENNLVAACCACQFGRNQWTLAEVGFDDPNDRQPICDSWDGLSRLARSGASS